MELVISPMTEGDVAELAELERLCFTTPWSRQSIAAELQKDNSLFLTAHDGTGRPVGYVGMNTVADEGYIDNLAVRPDCRRNGIARKLLTALLEDCEAHRLAFATLEVRESNASAIALYSSVGFVKVGVRRRFYEKPVEDGIIMTKYFITKGENR